MASLLAVLAVMVNAQWADFHVIPQPQQVAVTTGARPFVLDRSVEVITPVTDESMQRNAQFLRQYVAQTSGIALSGGGRRCIVLRCDLNDRNPEAYCLRVTCDTVEINGASSAGVFHGLNTLRKALPAGVWQRVALPCGAVYDYPRFAYRGAHLDVCRHFFTVDEVKTFIDMLALHGINNFHWHLTDDQGWRIEIKRYPRLTQVGAWRDSTVIGRNSGRWNRERHGGFYTQEEAREVVRYAAERHINVIPEIEMPGHTQAVLASYPELGCTGGPYGVWTCWGVTPEVLCPGNDDTFTFIRNVLNEVMDVFPSPIIGIGGDECPKDRWRVCSKCQARIRKEGLTAQGRITPEAQLQGLITHFASEIITARGRAPMGWDEILECDVPQQAVVLSWRGQEGAVDGARRGNRVILSPTSHMYFDYYQSRDTEREPYAFGGYIPVQKVYDFEAVPESLSPEQAELVMGCQANLWTEYIETFSHVQYMELPRMAALCETQWTMPERKDYSSFLSRLPRLLAHYRLLGYNYARHVCE